MRKFCHHIFLRSWVPCRWNLAACTRASTCNRHRRYGTSGDMPLGIKPSATAPICHSNILKVLAAHGPAHSDAGLHTVVNTGLVPLLHDHPRACAVQLGCCINALCATLLSPVCQAIRF
jgi:hypothetical protein